MSGDSDGPQDLRVLDEEAVKRLRETLDVTVKGWDVPKPCWRFEQFPFDAPLMAAIQKAGFENPTNIQAQSIPVALCGRDVIGIAKTGSGKTASYVWPMIVHMMDQPELPPGAGPIGESQRL